MKVSPPWQQQAQKCSTSSGSWRLLLVSLLLVIAVVVARAIHDDDDNDEDQYGNNHYIDYAWINEFHYANAGGDRNEFIEVAFLATPNYIHTMSQYKIYLYNGNGGVVYGKSYTFAPENVTLGGPSSGLHFWVVQTPGLQNGPDGIALVAVGVTIRGDNEEDDDHDVVVEFLSYDGSFVAQDGPAKGHASMDVGVSETNSVPVVTTSQGSLQRVALGGGGGCRLGDNFPSRRWIRTHNTNTRGRVNVQQSFPCVVTTAWINELHYKNKGSDRNEFVEVAFLVGPTPPDDWSFVLAGYQLILYNGHNGKTYRTYNFSTSSFSSSSNNNTTTTVTTDDNGLYFWVVDTPGIQNGSPDGVALVYNNSRVVEFLSYEGSFVATNGPAMGQTSRDIGVQESSTRTLANHSLQRIGKGCLGYDFATWSSSNNSLNTKGRLNVGQDIDCDGSAPTSRPGSTSRRAFWWWSTPSPPSSDSIVKRDYGPFQLYIQCGSSYGYAVRFSYELKGPDRHDHPRASTYFEDEELPQNCQQKSFRSYSHSNCGSLSNRKKNPFCFDRGHLVAANHLDKSVHYMELSNVMTNILPQASGLNQAGGAWHRTEDIVECARDLPNVARQVIFGGAFFDDDSNDYFLQSHGIPTPDHFWKVVVRYYKGFFTTPQVAGWLMPNRYTSTKDKLYTKYLTPVARIQRLTGDPMPELPSTFTELTTANPADWWGVPFGCDYS